jgi:hypothetical protein
MLESGGDVGRGGELEDGTDDGGTKEEPGAEFRVSEVEGNPETSVQRDCENSIND